LATRPDLARNERGAAVRTHCHALRGIARYPLVLFYNDFPAFPYRPISDDIRQLVCKSVCERPKPNLMLAERVPSIGAGKVANRDVRHRRLWPVLAEYMGTSARRR
jgi:hypothetical protein